MAESLQRKYHLLLDVNMTFFRALNYSSWQDSVGRRGNNRGGGAPFAS